MKLCALLGTVGLAGHLLKVTGFKIFKVMGEKAFLSNDQGSIPERGMYWL